MSCWSKIVYSLINLAIKLLINSKIIPSNFAATLNNCKSQPIIYVLSNNSKIDLLTLRVQCLKYRLPDPLTLLNINGVTLPSYIYIQEPLNAKLQYIRNSHSISTLHSYLNLHRLDNKLDIHLAPVIIMFGRSPDNQEISKINQHIQLPQITNNVKKFLKILWLGRDSFIRFSHPLSLRNIISRHGSNIYVAQKLARVLKIHFIRQKLVATGPRLPIKQDLFNNILISKTIEKAVRDEARSKKIPVDKAKQNAFKCVKEIAAKFSYETIRLSDRILSWAWKKLYQDLQVYNADRVHQLANEGKEIVYIPCHRSHMDYLLLSYVIYHQGLIPPHIAAGINLNFWPLGQILRRLGAFFIRRSFERNKLYSAIFREYLRELLIRGYPIEYFIEGKRSRTGKLLEPRTGILTMTIQIALQGSSRPITLVPIYIGYEHIIEVNSYAKELLGATKKPEGIWQMINGLLKLRNFGLGYINFGDPISLNHWLSSQVPQWRDHVKSTESYKHPAWLIPAANSIANTLMVRINNAATANAINLCSTILLASQHLSITRMQLLRQLACYLELLRNVPYASDIAVPDLTPEILLDHALAMNKFTVEQDIIGDIICLSREQAILMSYYRNNIQHLFILPSLVANIIYRYPGIKNTQLCGWVKILYPLLKAELFMCYCLKQIPAITDNIIVEIVRQGLVYYKEKFLYPKQNYRYSLQLLADVISETLYRYAVVFMLLDAKKYLNRVMLEKSSKMITYKLFITHNINAFEYFDKALFSTLMATLRTEKYISNTGNIVSKKVKYMCNILNKLISPDVLSIIKQYIAKSIVD